jgi:short-subunit dehydrogenase
VPAATPTRRVAVISGASSGIGAATARLLSQRGWRCVLLARRAEPLASLAAQLDGEAEPCDVGSRAAVDATAGRILERHPAVHLLVSNAGILVRGTFVDVDLDAAEEAMRVNYLGGLWLVRALQPGLRLAGRAHVVNVVSIGGAITFPPASAYSASKHAQLAFSRSLRAALAGSGIDVHTVMPGFVTTPGFPHPSFFRSRLGRRFVVDPERVAQAIVRAVERGQREVVVPWFPYRLGPVAQALFPSLTARVVASLGYPDDEAPPDEP